MNSPMKLELTPTRVERESSTPRSTHPGEEVNRIWPPPEHVAGPGWTLDIPVSQDPPEEALLDVVMTFGGGNVRMEAVDIAVSAEGREAPDVYGRLIDAVRSHLEALGHERAELLRYTPDAWFKFVPPDQASIGERGKTLTERLNEAYDGAAEREDEEFFRNTRAYYQRRRNAED